jgi:hyperosmotically inducible periplasmic protein
MQTLPRVISAAFAVFVLSTAQAQTAPDNTRQNSINAMNKTASADMQKNDETDLALTKHIRASVMADKSLSTYAHNIKIVAVNGNVTLSGVVHTQQEKDSIEAKAQGAVNNGSVVNNLKIAP